MPWQCHAVDEAATREGSREGSFLYMRELSPYSRRDTHTDTQITHTSPQTSFSHQTIHPSSSKPALELDKTLKLWKTVNKYNKKLTQIIELLLCSIHLIHKEELKIYGRLFIHCFK